MKSIVNLTIAMICLFTATSHATGKGICAAQAASAVQGLAQADTSIPTTLVGTGSINQKSEIDGSLQTVEIYSFSSELRSVDISLIVGLIVGSPCRISTIEVKQYD